MEYAKLAKCLLEAVAQVGCKMDDISLATATESRAMLRGIAAGSLVLVPATPKAVRAE